MDKGLLTAINDLFDLDKWTKVDCDDDKVRIKYNGGPLKVKGNPIKDSYSALIQYLPESCDDYDEKKLYELVEKAVSNLRTMFQLTQRKRDALDDKSKGKRYMLVKSISRIYGELVHTRAIEDELILVNAQIQSQEYLAENLKQQFCMLFKVSAAHPSFSNSKDFDTKSYTFWQSR